MLSFMFIATMWVKELVMLVGYVKSNAFPKPLSEAEEEQQLKRMEQGDKQARNRLVEHNLRLVAHLVKRL